MTALSGYTLTENVESLRFTGTGNFLGIGNDLANSIQGGAGNDTLIGGAGADTLIGSTGEDVFGFTSIGGGVDRISDFSVVSDHIGLLASAFGVSTVADFNFVRGTAPVATDDRPTLLYNTSTGALYFDAPGDAGPVQLVVLANAPGLAHADILLL